MTVTARRRLPVVTIAVVLASVGAHLAPPLGAALAYDRARLLDGELWRLATGSLAHVSAAHLAANALAALALGTLVEHGGARRAAALYASAALLVGVALLALAPEMVRYAGLSGIVHALAAAAALDLARAGGRRGAAGYGALGLLALRVAHDVAEPRTVAVAGGGTADVAVVAHAAGIAAGLLVHAAAAVVDHTATGPRAAAWARAPLRRIPAP